MTILDEIRAYKETELAAHQSARPLESIIAACSAAPAVRPFADALRPEGRPGLIAEVKRRSPAKGELRPDADAPSLAGAYFGAGANAVSVLTDQHFFSGADNDLVEVRSIAPGPLLRKDFVIDEYQVYEARSLGADAILLIVSMLSDRQLAHFREIAGSLGMDALVETHTADEVRRAAAAGATIIGINNRDLATFTVDLGTIERLAALVPATALLVSESGILSRDDVKRVTAAGARAVLIGEALVTAPDPGAKIAELLGQDHR